MSPWGYVNYAASVLFALALLTVLALSGEPMRLFALWGLAFAWASCYAGAASHVATDNRTRDFLHVLGVGLLICAVVCGGWSLTAYTFNGG